MAGLMEDSRRTPSDHVSSTFLRVAQTGTPKPLRELQAINPMQLPVVCKVDLMESVDGSYQIAEIDGTNHRGMGYSTLTAELRSLSDPDAATFPGCAAILAETVLAMDRTELTLLYPELERFYRPEFEVLESALCQRGVTLHLHEEGQPEALRFTDLADPLLLHLGHYNRFPVTGQETARRYAEGTLQTLFPPKPWLSSKGLLALLRNEAQDKAIEDRLREFVPGDALDKLRAFIPETHLISKRSEFCRALRAGSIAADNYVLKASQASGMKGTVFPDDPCFPQALEQALRTRDMYVLQRIVENRPVEYRYFPNETSNAAEATWFQRVVTHVTLRSQDRTSPLPGGSIADITVTARQDRAVHGAPDCIQIGSVLR